VPHLPANRRAGWRADEKEPPCIRAFEIFLLVADRCWFAKIAPCDCVAEEGGAVELLADADGRLGVVEGADDAVEGFKGRKGV